MTDVLIFIAIGVPSALVLITVGIFIGIAYRKNVSEKTIGSAETEAAKIINDAMKQADTKKKETLLEAKEEIYKNKTEVEKELKERRNEVTQLEKRIIQKEEALDKKIVSLEKKEENLQVSIQNNEKRKEELEELRLKQITDLETISGYTTDQAKEYLLQKIENDVRHDASLKIKEIEARFKEEADGKAKNIITLAIQRMASDYVAETTVSVVELPSDDMKGRIIGREGRNIKTLETLTGVDLIIDDTPEAITLSSFDPVRREIARISLEKLITDGRIHPSRIEETVEKAKKEVDAVIKAEGERAMLETNVHNLHPELVKLLGRMRYRTSYGQNVLNHSIEVSHLSGMIAAEIGIDVNLAKRAGLLHDIGKSIDHETEGSHIEIGVDLAKKYRESEGVIHAIHAHHNDVEPQTLIACIIQATDAISAARPGARRENLENYIKRLEKLESIANEFTGIEKSFAIQAGREIRIMVKPDEVADETLPMLARDIVKKIEEELEYPGQIKVHVIRENRAIEFAK